MTASFDNQIKTYSINLDDDDYFKNLKEITAEKNIHGEGVLSIYNGEFFKVGLDFYYNRDGVVEFDKNISDVPIIQLREYGISFDDNITIAYLNGIGGTVFGVDLYELYEQIELFVSTHPVLAAIASSAVMKVLKKILEYIENKKCVFNIFKKALYHKKKFTDADFMKAFELDEIDDDFDNKKAACEILLEYMGYEYDEKRKIWILNDKKKLD